MGHIATASVKFSHHIELLEGDTIESLQTLLAESLVHEDGPFGPFFSVSRQLGMLVGEPESSVVITVADEDPAAEPDAEDDDPDTFIPDDFNPEAVPAEAESVPSPWASEPV